MLMANHDTEPRDDGEGSSDSLDDLFCEIWERESQPELRFAIVGVGSVRSEKASWCRQPACLLTLLLSVYSCCCYAVCPLCDAVRH